MQVYGDQTYNHNPVAMKAFSVTNMTLWEEAPGGRQAGGRADQAGWTGLGRPAAAGGARVRLAFDDCGWRVFLQLIAQGDQIRIGPGIFEVFGVQFKRSAQGGHGVVEFT